jgi:hypothetical protein
MRSRSPLVQHVRFASPSVQVLHRPTAAKQQIIDILTDLQPGRWLTAQEIEVASALDSSTFDLAFNTLLDECEIIGIEHDGVEHYQPAINFWVDLPEDLQDDDQSLFQQFHVSTSVSSPFAQGDFITVRVGAVPTPSSLILRACGDGFLATKFAGGDLHPASILGEVVELRRRYPFAAPTRQF